MLVLLSHLLLAAARSDAARDADDGTDQNQPLT